MIDKLDIRVDQRAPFARPLSQIYHETGSDPKVWRSSALYERSADLREFNIPAYLHLYNRLQGTHKVELFDVGEMTYSDVQDTLLKIFSMNPKAHGLLRVDLAADVPEVPVNWFHRSARIQRKQFFSTIGVLWTEMGKREIQTLYFGKRPNCFRIYDKVAEYEHQYQRLTRGMDEATEKPEFETLYGVARSATLTRVERQMGGGRLPELLKTVGDVPKALRSEFNPFEPLEILPIGKDSPVVDGRSERGLMKHFAGLQLRHMIEEFGMNHTRGYVNQRSMRNWKRIAREYADYMPSEAGASAEQIHESYRVSLAKQIRG